MANNFQKFLSVIAQWPVCATRKSRDYGFHLRTLAKQGNDANFFPVKEADADKIFRSITRLIQDRYKNKYKCSYKKGASGLDPETVSVVLTDEFIEYFNKSLGFTKYLFK